MHAGAGMVYFSSKGGLKGPLEKLRPLIKFFRTRGLLDHWKFHKLIAPTIGPFDQIFTLARTIGHFDQISTRVRTINHFDQGYYKKEGWLT